MGLLNNYVNSRRQRFLIRSIVFGLFPVMLLRLLINPQFLTNYCLESNLTNETALVLCAPSLVIFEGIRRCAPGASKWLVLALLGAPRFKESKLMFPGCSPDLSEADEVWFYEIAPHGLILLCFKGDCCALARGFTWSEGDAYATWKTDQIQKLAIGQTESELESWLGNCFMKDPKLMRLILIASGVRCEPESLWTNIPGEFYISSGSVIRLEMCNGRFVKAQSLAIFH